jgi:beta-lactamase superfamily II metal-dependent hydrolase
MNILIDSGGSATREVGKDTLLPYLLKNGVAELDLVVITHLHTDHYKGLTEIAREIPVRRLAVYDGNRLKSAEIIRDSGVPEAGLMYIHAGHTIRLGEHVSLEAIYPERRGMEEYRRIMLGEGDENMNSLLMKLDYKGFTALMTGDVGFEGEEAALEALRGREGALRCSVLKVGHHGSRYSTSDAFLEAVSPQAAVIQSGKNTYGHPHPSVIQKLEGFGAKVYRNDESGAVLFRVMDDGSAEASVVVAPGKGV